MIVRIADKMGANMQALVPFGKGLAPTWASPAARSPARPTATPSGSPPTTSSPSFSPFDPFAILDEIQRLVPGYNLLRLQLLCGNDQHLAARRCCASSRSATAAISSCPPTTLSSPPGPSAATPPCSPTCSTTRASVPNRAYPDSNRRRLTTAKSEKPGAKS